MEMIVDPVACTGCGACVSVCPSAAVSIIEGAAVIDQSLCTVCQRCLGVCPTGAISTVEMLDAAAKTTTSASRSLKVIDAEHISVNQKPWRDTLVELGIKILPYLYNAVTELFDSKLKNQNPSRPNHSFNKTSHPSSYKRHRRKHRGRSGRI